MSLLEVLELSHSYGDKILYKNTSFDLHKGEHVGVVGQNGAGKSTLIDVLAGRVIQDKGDVRWQRGIIIGYLDQYAIIDKDLSIIDYLHFAFSNLYQLEQDVHKLYDEYAANGDNILLEKASLGQAKLEAQGFYIIDNRVDKVVEGLGLSALGLSRHLSKLSGGQRAKVILAKLLLEQPDVLLLDEPTNFLDKAHVDWLVNYLMSFPNAFAVVSHDFNFLDKVTTCICDVEAETVKKYHGSYSNFLQQKEHLRNDHIRRYNEQQQVIKRTEEFIRKNIAGVNSKNAKGRRKHLERLERVAPPTFLSKPTLRFHEAQGNIQNALQVEELEIGYEYVLLPKLTFSILSGEKLAITGFNGIGKSTLLKTLSGEISAISGTFRFAEQVKIGYYGQDICWEDANMTPIQVIASAFPKMAQGDIRKCLANCGVKKDSVLQAISTLSGGEQSKVKLCKLILNTYNFLILDEPTNHLDADTKVELYKAITQFKGCVIIVSHEEIFYKGLVDKVFDIESGKVI